jgi:DNA-binding transcriptional ArsR family regulator
MRTDQDACMPTQPLDLMFSGYRRGILAQLLLRPDEAFHVRELERMTGIPAGSLHRELKALFEAGLLSQSRQGNQVRYRANRSSPIYEELAGIFRKTSGLVDVLREALHPLADRISIAFVFGSMATGAQHVGSDVDIFILGRVSLLDVVKALAQAQERLAREMNPVVMSKKKFLEAQKANDRFVRRILDEPKLFVVGDANVLEELA